VAASNGKKPPQIIKYLLDQLSTMPKQIEELKMSAAHAGAITSLSQAKAYQTELDPEEMASGFPEYKASGSIFSEAHYAKCIREMRPLAC